MPVPGFDKIEDIANSLDIRMMFDGNGGVELEYYTRVGEDCIVSLDASTPDIFVLDLADYINKFDAEEYEWPWIEMGREKRIERGAPRDIRDFLDSANELRGVLDEFLSGIYTEYRKSRRTR